MTEWIRSLPSWAISPFAILVATTIVVGLAVWSPFALLAVHRFFTCLRLRWRTWRAARANRRALVRTAALGPTCPHGTLTWRSCAGCAADFGREAAGEKISPQPGTVTGRMSCREPNFTQALAPDGTALPMEFRVYGPTHKPCWCSTPTSCRKPPADVDLPAEPTQVVRFRSVAHTNDAFLAWTDERDRLHVSADADNVRDVVVHGTTQRPRAIYVLEGTPDQPYEERRVYAADHPRTFGESTRVLVSEHAETFNEGADFFYRRPRVRITQVWEEVPAPELNTEAGIQA